MDSDVIRLGKVRCHPSAPLPRNGPGLLAHFIAVTQIPIANAVLLRATNPLFVPLLAALVYRRMSDRNVWLGVVIGFIGMVCVIAPEPDGWGLSYGDIAGVLSGAMGGAAALAIWALSGHDRPQTQMFYFSIFSLACALLPIPWFWQTATAAALPRLFWMALFTTLAQALLAAACARAPADKILSWGYTSVIFGAAIGYSAWGEQPTLLSITGIALAIYGANLASRKTKGAGKP